MKRHTRAGQNAWLGPIVLLLLLAGAAVLLFLNSTG